MGLDIFAWIGAPEYQFSAGSYTGFHNFRELLADSVYIDLYEMKGYGGNRSWHNKPFEELMSHSDYDGYLYENDCVNLSKDFRTNKDHIFDSIAKNHPDDFAWFIAKFNEWFELIDHIATHGGIVVFR